jgi:hypothetical protein
VSRSRGVFGRPGWSHAKPQIVDSTGVFAFWRLRLFLDTGKRRATFGSPEAPAAPSGAARLRQINDVPKPATIDKAKAKDKRHDLTDGGGLLRGVMPSGSKSRCFKGHLNGKPTKVTIDAFPAFTGKEARDAIRNCARWSGAAAARRTPSGHCGRNKGPLTRAA